MTFLGALLIALIAGCAWGLANWALDASVFPAPPDNVSVGVSYGAGILIGWWNWGRRRVP